MTYMEITYLGLLTNVPRPTKLMNHRLCKPLTLNRQISKSRFYIKKMGSTELLATTMNL